MIQKQDLRSPQNAPWTPRSAAMTMGSFSVRSAVVRTSARWDKSACVTRKSLPGFADFFFLPFTKKTFLCDAYVESWNECFWWLLVTFAKTCGGQRGRRALLGTACVMPPEYKQYHSESLLICLSVSGGMELLNGTNFDKQIQLIISTDCASSLHHTARTAWYHSASLSVDQAFWNFFVVHRNSYLILSWYLARGVLLIFFSTSKLMQTVALTWEDCSMSW